MSNGNDWYLKINIRCVVESAGRPFDREVIHLLFSYFLAITWSYDNADTHMLTHTYISTLYRAVNDKTVYKIQTHVEI